MEHENIGVDRFYESPQSGLRKTDETSFKLIGLVPLVSGAGLLMVLLAKDVAAPLPVGPSSLAGVVTLDLFRPELRSIQTRLWHDRLAKKIEAQCAKPAGLSAEGLRRPKSPGGFGKREAEKLIYAATIASWLALPLATRGLFVVRLSLRALFVVGARAILGFTVRGLRARLEAEA